MENNQNKAQTLEMTGKHFSGQLTPERVAHIKEVMASDLEYDDKLVQLTKAFMRSRRSVQEIIAHLQSTGDIPVTKPHAKAGPTVVDPDEIAATSRQLDRSKSYFIITCAMNETPVHDGFWQSIKAYAKHLNAAIHVVPVRYKNPTSVFVDRTHDTWASEIKPYLDLNRHAVSKNLSLLSDIKIQPTAITPLNGLAGFANGKSIIVAHPKLHMTAVPVLEGEHKIIMFTTGCCTVPNYTDSLAGKKGEFHHQMGFVIVEVDGDHHHVRQVAADSATGAFTDLIYRVTPQGVEQGPNPVAVILGDLHVGDTDANKMKATQDLLDTLEPNYIVLHDVFNAHSVSPHVFKDPIERYHNIGAGRSSLANEVREMIATIDGIAQSNPRSKVVCVAANHDDMLDRYVRQQDWKGDIPNAAEYAKYLSLSLAGKAPNGLIPYIIETETECKALGRDESFKPGEYQLGYHGDQGLNGSKGSALQYSRLGTKTVIGHSHTPVRMNGCLSVGTSTKLRVGYNTGASSWVHADVIEHPDGSAQHVVYDERYKFTTMI